MPEIQYAHVNEKGEVVLPPQVARELGSTPGDEIQIEPNGYGYHVHPSIHQLKRVYVETNMQSQLQHMPAQCLACAVWSDVGGNF